MPQSRRGGRRPRSRATRRTGCEVLQRRPRALRGRPLGLDERSRPRRPAPGALGRDLVERERDSGSASSARSNGSIGSSRVDRRARAGPSSAITAVARRAWRTGTSSKPSVDLVEPQHRRAPGGPPRCDALGPAGVGGARPAAFERGRAPGRARPTRACGSGSRRDLPRRGAPPARRRAPRRAGPRSCGRGRRSTRWRSWGADRAGRWPSATMRRAAT